jgi:hypothetical protein
MAALFRILALLLMLLAQALLRGPFGAHWIFRIAAPTKTPAATATATVTSQSFTASVTPILTQTPMVTPAPSDTPTVRPTVTFTLARAPTSTFTAVPTQTASASATLTAVPPATPSPTSTRTWTSTVPPTFTASPTSTAASSGVDPTGFDVVGVPPAQKLPSALLIYPLVQASATQETRIELMNLTSASVSVECFYVTSVTTNVTCNETGFFLTLTANQPVSWLASTGAAGSGGRIAPPFSGEGELKCVVTPSAPDLNSHNALQGRALISDTAEQIIGYSAIGFRRLTAGDFTGVVSLDGVTYEQCPDRLHFNVLTSQPGSDSELVLVPCSEDLEAQIASRSTIQFAVMNEFEQHSSGAATLACFLHQPFSRISALRRSQVGTDTAHVIVRGIDVPVVGLVIDRFTVPGSGALSTSSNEPYLEGGRSAGVNLP